MSLNHEVSVVSATLVPENLRLQFLPEQFGKFMLKGEALVYGWLEQLRKTTREGFGIFTRCQTVGFTWLRAATGDLR
jgi:hypothetical protein